MSTLIVGHLRLVQLNLDLITQFHHTILIIQRFIMAEHFNVYIYMSLNKLISYYDNYQINFNK